MASGPRQKNRILIFGWAKSVHIQRWVAGLTNRGWQIKVVSPGGEAIPGVETKILPHNGSRSYLTQCRSAVREIDSFKPNLVHVHYAFGFGWWGYRSGFHPMVVSVWGTDVVKLAANPFTRMFGAKLFKSADAITGSSRFLTNQTLRNWPKIEAKLSIIPFGIPIPKEPSPLPNSAPVRICYVKWHQQVYGPDILLKAMAILKKRGLDIQLDLAGSGDVTDSLRTMIQQLQIGSVAHLTGALRSEEVSDFIAARSIMIMPSRMESFGVTALEAAAVGRAVIASNVGGIPEVVLHEKTGLLVPPENPEALADAIARLASNPVERERMGKAAHAFAKDNYDWERSLDLMSGLYERVIDAR